MMMNKNRLLLAGLLAGVAAIFYWGLHTQPIPVDLAVIQKGDLAVTVNEEGVTRIREIYTVSAPVSGLVRRLSLKQGDRIQKGKTIVAVIEPISPAFQDVRSLSILRANVKSAQAALTLSRAELSRVQADYDYAKAEFKRTSRLYKKRITSRKNYDQALAGERKAKAAINASKANVEVRAKELESIRAKLIQPSNRSKRKKAGDQDCCLSIAAPVTGRVLSLKHKSEQVVTAGTPLLELGNDQDLEIVVDLLSADAVKVRTGASAELDGWGGQTLLAKVRHIEPAGFTKVSALGIEEQRVKVVLDLMTKNLDHSVRLGHDFRVFARIRIWEGSDLLLVPLSALFRQGKDWVVFVANGTNAQLKKIKIDHRTQHFAQITKGLAKGDQVILHPSDRIKDGTLISDRSKIE